MNEIVLQLPFNLKCSQSKTSENEYESIRMDYLFSIESNIAWNNDHIHIVHCDDNLSADSRQFNNDVQ